MNAIDRSNCWKETAAVLAGEKSAVASITLNDDIVRIEFESRRGL